MIPSEITDFLRSRQVPYEVLGHRETYTAQNVAAALHVSGRDFAKAVMLRAPHGEPVMAVVQAPRHVDLRALSNLAGVRLELADEDEFEPLFPHCELGAEPPLGLLYDVPMYVDADLLRDPEIVFNAGTHKEAIRMRSADFERLVGPPVGRFSRSH